MYTIQPTRLHKYLGLQPQKLQTQYQRTFFASWEDALWEVLQQKSIQSGTVLVPDFFCLDVVANMRAHGLKTVYYRLDKNLQPVLSDFIQKLRAANPAIVVLFHAVGIGNTLLETFDTWKRLLPSNTIVLEDCVHRVLSLPEVTLRHPNHVVIDSLRKVVPLMGAQCITHQSFGLQTTTPTATTKHYGHKVVLLWLRFQYYLYRAAHCRSRAEANKWNAQAEAAMLAGYDVIGDNYQGAAGSVVFSWLSRYLAISAIRAAKIWQVAAYQNALSERIQNTPWVRSVPFRQPHELRGYPLVVANAVAKDFLHSLRSKGLLIRYELLDCPWSERQKIMYLPLGPHLSPADITWMCTTVSSALRAV